MIVSGVNGENSSRFPRQKDTQRPGRRVHKASFSKWARKVFRTPDASCRVRVANPPNIAAGDLFVNSALPSLPTSTTFLTLVFVSLEAAVFGHHLICGRKPFFRAIPNAPL